MCTFISGYIGWDGKLYFGDFSSHSSAEETHDLGKALRSDKPPVPFEWPSEDSGESIDVRIPENVDRDVNYYKAIILSEADTRSEFFKSNIAKVNHIGGSLYVSGCKNIPDLSGINVKGEKYGVVKR